MWRLRRAFWNWLLTFKYRHNKPLVVPPPVAGERPIEPVPLAPSSRISLLPVSPWPTTSPKTRPRPCHYVSVSCKQGFTTCSRPCNPACRKSTPTLVPHCRTCIRPPTSAASLCPHATGVRR